MKTLTALIIALTTLTSSIVNAVELNTSDRQVAVYLPSAEQMTLAWDNTATENATGECKAVCMLPSSVD